MIKTSSAFLGRGFRPFFLGGALYTIFSIILWSGYYAGHVGAMGIFSDPALWHIHEMIYGFTIAIIAGFLLTAVANCTGTAPVKGGHLAGLAALWLAGRIIFCLPAVPLWAIAIVDISFVPALALSLLWPLWRTKNIHNLIFVGILSALTLCNIMFYIMQSRLPLYAALLLVILVISAVGGRIVPSFTVARLRYAGQNVRQRDVSVLDNITLAALVLLIGAVVLWGFDSRITGIAALIAALAQAVRWGCYYPLKALVEPTLWILHTGFFWMVTGLFMLALAGFQFLPLSPAIHALTVGCIGSMIIGMLSRVTLGHTGRPIRASRLTMLAFILMQGAALIRVAGPLLAPEAATSWIIGSGLLWAACFTLYVVEYAPMLWRPRPDGLVA